MNIRKRVKRLLLQNPRKANYKFVLKDWMPLLDLSACSQVLETKRFFRQLVPIEMDKPDAGRVLVIAPHPDDDVFGPGGTLIKCVRSGCKVHTVYLTDVGKDEVHSQIIRNEVAEAEKIIGSRSHFIGMDLNKILLRDDDRVSSVSKIIEEVDPEALFITFLLDDHDDHRRANELLLTIAPQLSVRPKEVWAYQIYSTVIPNVVVNITDVVDDKARAIRLFRSVSGERDWAHYILGMNATNCRYIASRSPIYVETFFVTPWQEYLELCRTYFSHGKDRVYYHQNYTDR